jgi:hypothetical protein
MIIIKLLSKMMINKDINNKHHKLIFKIKLIQLSFMIFNKLHNQFNRDDIR